MLTNGTYATAGGARQRYRCFDRTNPKATKHTFTAPLPRALVAPETCCDDCEVPTPRHAGPETATRRGSYPASVVFAVLNDLAEGRAYTHTSIRALERMGRPAGRRRTVAGRSVRELNDAGSLGPDRDAKAHWHIAADVLERFGPLVTEPTFEQMRGQEDEYRDKGLPVVYVADEVPVKRDFARSYAYNSSPVVWNALVISRMKWEHDAEGNLVGRSSRLVRVRALANVTKEAWALVFSELPAPDFLVADGAAAIKSAAQVVWGPDTTFVPCLWHAMENIRTRLSFSRGRQLPEKVRDHLFALTREGMAQTGPAGVTTWFDGLAVLAQAEQIPMETVTALRRQYEPLLAAAAMVAQNHVAPPVPVSNASVENQISTWVEKMTRRRGAMFANLARTNLLGDLIVAGANGALLRPHEVIGSLRTTARSNGGWTPPPRALTEPAGTFALRDATSILQLLSQGSA